MDTRRLPADLLTHSGLVDPMLCFSANLVPRLSLTISSILTPLSRRLRSWEGRQWVIKHRLRMAML